MAVVSPVFVALLFLTAFDVGLVRTVTHPATVKKLVADSGIYSSVVSSSLQQLKSIDTSWGTIDASNPLVQKAANQAVTPRYVQQQAESAIDNIYQWLNGDIPRPDFNINLNGQKDQFAKNAAASLQQQLASLPTCQTLAEIQSFSVLNATCLPPGVTAQDIASQVQTDLSNSDFLSQANISATNITGQNSGKSIFDNRQVKNLPRKYRLVKKTPWILALVTILCGLGVVFLSRSWPVGLRHVGVNLAVIGGLMLALSLFLPGVVSQDIAPKLQVNSSGVNLNLSKVVNDVTRQIDKNYWFFGGAYAILGAAAITAGEIFRRRGSAATSPKTIPTGNSTSSPATSARR